MKEQLDLTIDSGSQERHPSIGPSARRLPLVLAVLAALAQGLVVFRCASAAHGDGQFTRIAVSRGLKRGQVLSADNVSFSIRVAAADATASGTFLTESEFQEFEGRYLTEDFPEGTPLTRSRTSEVPVLPLDVEGIPPGQVLFPVPVKLGALARLLSPGQRVDVLAHMTLPDVGAVTETLLEAVPLVGIGESEDADGRARGDVVSFHLRPEEMKLLVHAQKFSEFHLALRNPKEVAAGGKNVAMTLSRFLANPRIQQALSSDVFRIRNGAPPGADSEKGGESDRSLPLQPR
jgi:Flp pilus assembly protein CpaB